MPEGLNSYKSPILVAQGASLSLSLYLKSEIERERPF